MQHYPNGIGGSLGDSLVTGRPLYASASVWYVHSETGTDASGNAGRDEAKPLATLAQAHTNAAAGDIIVLLDGHEETFTSLLTVSKAGIVIVGEGSSAGKPTVRLTNNQAAAGMLLLSGAGAQLRNVWIEENLQACSAARVTLTGDGSIVSGCYFECGGTDEDAALVVNADNVTVRSSTFISTATDADDRPSTGLSDGGASLTDLHIIDCVFSDGTVGFSSGYAMDINSDITRLRGENISLLLGAEVLLTAGTSGYFMVSTSTGGARVVW